MCQGHNIIVVISYMHRQNDEVFLISIT